MNEELKKWADEVKAKLPPRQVDYKNYKVTNNELNNLCYLSMKYLIGWQMRAVDFHAVNMMVNPPPTTVESLEAGFIPELAEYMWDHLMGEPEEIQSEDLVYAIKIIRDQLFSMDEQTRNSI